MQELKQTLLAYWQLRNARERKLLSLMAAVLAVAVLYAGIWEPARASVVKNRAAVLRLEAERTQVAALATEAGKLKRQSGISPLPAKELMPIIQQQAKSVGLPSAGWQLSADGEAGVRLEGALPFDGFARLVGALAAQNQIRVQTLRAEAMQPGQVHVKALFTHAGSEA